MRHAVPPKSIELSRWLGQRRAKRLLNARNQWEDFRTLGELKAWLTDELDDNDLAELVKALDDEAIIDGADIERLWSTIRGEKPARVKGDMLAVEHARKLQAASDNGLVFVPDLVASLTAGGMKEADAKAAILNAATRDAIELRPEGGIGRLSAAERAQCIPGPQKTILSWARVR